MRFCSLGSSRRNFYFLEPWHSSCLPPGSKPSFPGFIQSGRHRVAMIPVARGINIASFHTDPLDITCVWPTFFKSSLVKAAASAVGMSCVSRLLVPRVFTWWLYLRWMAANKWGLNVTTIVVGYEICWGFWVIVGHWQAPLGFSGSRCRPGFCFWLTRYSTKKKNDCRS